MFLASFGLASLGLSTIDSLGLTTIDSVFLASFGLTTIASVFLASLGLTTIASVFLTSLGLTGLEYARRVAGDDSYPRGLEHIGPICQRGPCASRCGH